MLGKTITNQQEIVITMHGISSDFHDRCMAIPGAWFYYNQIVILIFIVINQLELVITMQQNITAFETLFFKNIMWIIDYANCMILLYFKYICILIKRMNSPARCHRQIWKYYFAHYSANTRRLSDWVLPFLPSVCRSLIHYRRSAFWICCVGPLLWNLKLFPDDLELTELECNVYFL